MYDCRARSDEKTVVLLQLPLTAAGLIGSPASGHIMDEIIIPRVPAIAVIGSGGTEAGVEHDNVLVRIRLLRINILIIDKHAAPSFFPSSGTGKYVFSVPEQAIKCKIYISLCKDLLYHLQGPYRIMSP